MKKKYARKYVKQVNALKKPIRGTKNPIIKMGVRARKKLGGY
jgi:hypothetical protein